MMFAAVFSTVLLASLASAGPLQTSHGEKLIIDRGYVLGEATGNHRIDYFYRDNQFVITLRDLDGKLGHVRIGDGMSRPKVDIMQMSFVVELFPNYDSVPGFARAEEQVWYKESSASLLNQIDEISGECGIRELHAAERVQMEKFKRSHDGSHQFKVVYQDGATAFGTNLKTTGTLEVAVDGDKFDLRTTHGKWNGEQKSVSLMEIEGKSFVVEDAAESNCDSIESLAIRVRGYGCEGVWVEQL